MSGRIVTAKLNTYEFSVGKIHLFLVWIFIFLDQFHTDVHRRADGITVTHPESLKYVVDVSPLMHGHFLVTN